MHNWPTWLNKAWCFVKELMALNLYCISTNSFCGNYSFLKFENLKNIIYRTRVIITRGLYLFYPIFHCGLYLRAVFTAERLVFTWFFIYLRSPQKIEYLSIQSFTYYLKSMPIFFQVTFNKFNVSMERVAHLRSNGSNLFMFFHLLQIETKNADTIQEFLRHSKS